jgi:hypothetical protein
MRMYPVGAELEERRGWRPPPPSRGLTFAAVSFILIGIATTGTFFFLGPDSQKKTTSRSPEPISTTTTTSGDSLAANASANIASASPDTVGVATTEATSPSLAPNVVNRPIISRSIVPAEPPPTPAASPAKAKPAPAPHARNAAVPERKKNLKNETLPDLDRAAAAAGITPSSEDPFGTPHASDAPPAGGRPNEANPALPRGDAPRAETPQQGPRPSPVSPSAPPDDPSSQSLPRLDEPAPEVPAPSDVLPELRIKR